MDAASKIKIEPLPDFSESHPVGNLWSEIVRNPPFGIYLAIGIIVAIVYLRQQKMVESARSGGMLIPVALMVAFLWPLILLSMILLYLQPVKRFDKSKQITAQLPNRDDSRKK